MTPKGPGQDTADRAGPRSGSEPTDRGKKRRGSAGRAMSATERFVIYGNESHDENTFLEMLASISSCRVRMASGLVARL